MRVGDDEDDFSTANTIVKSGIVDGGLFTLTPVSGTYFNFRRDGANPDSSFTGNANFEVYQIKIYETVNLLQEYSGRVSITPDTS